MPDLASSSSPAAAEGSRDRGWCTMIVDCTERMEVSVKRRGVSDAVGSGGRESGAVAAVVEEESSRWALVVSGAALFSGSSSEDSASGALALGGDSWWKTLGYRFRIWPYLKTDRFHKISLKKG